MAINRLNRRVRYPRAVCTLMQLVRFRQTTCDGADEVIPPRRGGESAGFTLIEVLVSVVILVVVGTATALVLASVEQGSLQTAKYNQAAGLATTIAEDIKDKYIDNSTAFSITIPGDALGGNTAHVTISVPLPGQSVGPKPLLGGDMYNISCALPTSNTSNYNAAYTISVTDNRHQTFRINVLAHGVLGG